MTIVRAKIVIHEAGNTVIAPGKLGEVSDERAAELVELGAAEIFKQEEVQDTKKSTKAKAQTGSKDGEKDK